MTSAPAPTASSERPPAMSDGLTSRATPANPIASPLRFRKSLLHVRSPFPDDRTLNLSARTYLKIV